jgi:Flp pilus assembly protein TadD
VLLLAAPPPSASVEANEQFRLCLGDADDAASLAACRKALELGLPPARAAIVHDVMASKLGSLGRWDEAVATLRSLAELRPEDGEVHLRLGAGLLHGLDLPAEAVDPLRAAIGLAPSDPRGHAELGDALNQLGDHASARAAFDEALRLDPGYLDERPAARQAYEASGRGERWP